MKNSKRVAAIAGIVVLVLAAAILYAALWTGSTKEIEAVADKFQPGEEWVLTNEQIDQPRMMCLGGNPCPFLSRVWERNKAITLEEFTEYITKSGWDFPVKDDCKASDAMSGSVSLCSSKGTDDGYEITLSYSSPDIKKIEPKLSILVRKASTE